MTETPAFAPSESFDDVPLAFTIPDCHARGRIVRLGPVLDQILSAHTYPAPVKHLLAEAIVIAALIGSLVKDAGQLTMQAQTEGGVMRLLVVDYRDGELRGYADFNKERMTLLGDSPSLFALFGQGYLAITIDQPPMPGQDKGERYQGIVPLEGGSLSEACEHYFVQSEQIPTRIRVAVKSEAGCCTGAGLLVQHLPEGEEGRERLHVRSDDPDWEHVAILADTVTYAELLDEGLSMEALVWRLYHDENEVRVEPGTMLSKGCRCSVSHFASVLGSFPDSERDEMADDVGMINVDCAFCSKVFAIPKDGTQVAP